MKLLLTKDVAHLGIVGDVINVSPGYARNYLVPHGIATEATTANVRALAEERKQAEERRRVRMEAMRQRAERLKDVEVTIAAAANEEGVLYGSVGPREVAAALRDEGHDVEAAHVQMNETIGRLDNVTVRVKFADAIEADVKVWVVRSKATPAGEGEGAEAEK